MLISTVKDVVRDHADLSKQLAEVVTALKELGHAPDSRDVAKDQRHSVKLLYQERGRIERLMLRFENLEVGISPEGLDKELALFLGLEAVEA